MRFMASVPKDSLALLLQVTQALRRVELASSSCAGRRCVLRLSREGMSFGLVCAADDARAWADLDPRLFERYMVESRARGEVLLHVSLKQLVRALQKHSGDAIALRLAKNARAAPQLRLASQKRSVVLRAAPRGDRTSGRRSHDRIRSTAWFPRRHGRARQGHARGRGRRLRAAGARAPPRRRPRPPGRRPRRRTRRGAAAALSLIHI